MNFKASTDEMQRIRRNEYDLEFPWLGWTSGLSEWTRRGMSWYSAQVAESARVQRVSECNGGNKTSYTIHYTPRTTHTTHHAPRTTHHTPHTCDREWACDCDAWVCAWGRGVRGVRGVRSEAWGGGNGQGGALFGGRWWAPVKLPVKLPVKHYLGNDQRW